VYRIQQKVDIMFRLAIPLRSAFSRTVLALTLAVVSRPSGSFALEPPVLRASLESEPITLAWTAAHTGTDRFLASFLMRGLMKYDAGNQPVCDLCRSLALSPDGKTLTFELASGENWSDGVPLEAQHFVDSFRRLLDPANGFSFSEDFLVIAGATLRPWDASKLAVRAEDKNKVVIELVRPSGAFTHVLTTAASFPIRKELLKGADDTGERHAQTAVLGPYQLAAWEKGKRIVIEGNAKFTASRPVYRVDFFRGTHAQSLQKFKSGRIDLLSNPTSDDVLKVPGQRLQVSPYLATRLLRVNSSRKPLTDLNLRRALLLALDRPTLPAALRNGERRATGLIPPGLPGYRELPLVTPDLSQAQTLAKASFGSAPAPELTLITRDLEADRQVSEWLTSQWARIGIKLKVLSAAEGAYLRKLESGDFDLALGVWAFETASPVELLRSFETGAAQNRGHWTHVGFDALLGQLTRETNPSLAAGLIDRTAEVVEVKDIGVIPLGYPTQPFLLGRRVMSFSVTPFGDPNLVSIRIR
jgi:ABC-type oligopeptide transport system substrate-binding subunit